MEPGSPSLVYRNYPYELMLDVFFSALLGMAYVALLGIREGLGTVVGILVVTNLVKTVAWSVLYFGQLRPIAVWSRAGEGSQRYLELTRAAAVAAYGFPSRLAYFSAALWTVVYAPTTAVLLYVFPDRVALPPQALTVTVLFSVALAAGALVVVYPLNTLMHAPVTEKISLVAERLRVSVPRTGLSFRARIVLVSLCLGLAPTLFIGSMGLMSNVYSNLAQLTEQSRLATVELAREFDAAPETAGDALIGQLGKERYALFIATPGGEVVHGSAAVEALGLAPALSTWLRDTTLSAPSGAFVDPRTERAVSFERVSDTRIVGSVVRLDRSTSRSFLFTLGIFFLAVIVWAPLSAALLSGTIARTVDHIATVIRRIQSKESLHNVPRIPILSQDEIGTLAHGANAMVARLAESDAQVQAYLEDIERKNTSLEFAAAAKSEYLARLSHELRTPLNSIIGFTRILERKVSPQLDETQRTNLRLVGESGRHLVALVNDLLDLEKIGAGALTVNVREVEVEDIVTSTVATFFAQAEDRGLRLRSSVTTGPLEILTDRDRLRQILDNFVSNAIKYSTDGTIRIEAGRVGSELRFSVSDEGLGIASEDLPRVFEPFYQIDTPVSAEREGTGLGLAIVAKLAELLGGSVRVESKLGVGSTFTLVLPSSIISNVTDRLNIRDLYAPSGSGPVVLAVDSNVAELRSTRTYLLDAGYRVHCAFNASEGLAKAHELKPDAMVVDIQLRGTDGWSFLRDLRARIGTANVPVVVLTSAERRDEADELGVDAWLAKPADPSTLGDAVRSVVSAQGDILVVEDDSTTRRLVEQELGEMNLKIRAVADGESAIAALRDRVPHAMILDLMLPGVDGFAVLRHLRELPSGSDTAVVVYTAKDLTTDEHQRLARGFADIVPKHGGDNIKSIVSALEKAGKPK